MVLVIILGSLLVSISLCAAVEIGNGVNVSEVIGRSVSTFIFGAVGGLVVLYLLSVIL